LGDALVAVLLVNAAVELDEFDAVWLDELLLACE
jgi:hypothetical protein